VSLPSWMPRRGRLVFAVYIGVNLSAMLSFDTLGLPGTLDWEQWEALPAGIASGDLYDLGTELPYIYSPVAAPLLALIPAIGVWPWVALHVAAVLLLRDKLLIVLVLGSWAFWTDALVGNVFTFTFVAGAMARRGSRPAAFAYLALLLLMPRPVQIPLAVLLLWRTPALRWPFVGMIVLHAVAVVASGYAVDWTLAVAEFSAKPHFNIGPTHFVGTVWLVVGVPLAVLLFWRRRVGWAGLALSPYVQPQYLLMPFVDWCSRSTRNGRSRPAVAARSSQCSGG
jgi:hypothetical protein